MYLLTALKWEAQIEKCDVTYSYARIKKKLTSQSDDSVGLFDYIARPLSIKSDQNRHTYSPNKTDWISLNVKLLLIMIIRAAMISR